MVDFFSTTKGSMVFTPDEVEEINKLFIDIKRLEINLISTFFKKAFIADMESAMATSSKLPHGYRLDGTKISVFDDAANRSWDAFEKTLQDQVKQFKQKLKTKYNIVYDKGKDENNS